MVRYHTNVIGHGVVAVSRPLPINRRLTVRRCEMRRSACVCCATLTLVTTVTAQDQRPRRDAAIEFLEADAAGVPPEFEADVLIRLSQLPKVDRTWRREMLDTAYERAYAAPEQYRRSTNQQIPADSRQGAQLFANGTALTRVTLQIRAVQLMARIEPLHARDLFEWIELNLAPGACADPLVPAVDDYYGTLGSIARTAYANNRGDAMQFLEFYAWRAHLPSEIPAVARAMQRFRQGPVEAAYLEGLLRLILQGSSLDASGFSSAALDIVSRITDLQVADSAIGVTGFTAMDGMRSYLVAQLKAPRCTDNVSATVTPSTFNAALRRARADSDVSPLESGLTRPLSTLASAHIDMYWQSGDAARLHDGLTRLRGPDAVPVPMRTRQTVEWRSQAERLLTDVEQWSGLSEAAERDYFYEKSALFTWMLELIPPGALHTRALHAFVEFLRHTEADVSRRTLWFAFVNRLLELAHGASRAEILSAMEQSHQPVLSLYARLERVAPERRP